MNRNLDAKTQNEIMMVRAGLVDAERRLSFLRVLGDICLAAIGIAGFLCLLMFVYFGEELWRVSDLARSAS